MGKRCANDEETHATEHLNSNFCYTSNVYIGSFCDQNFLSTMTSVTRGVDGWEVAHATVKCASWQFIGMDVNWLLLSICWCQALRFEERNNSSAYPLDCRPELTTIMNNSQKSDSAASPNRPDEGMQRMAPLIAFFVALLSVIYGGFYLAFLNSPTIFGLTPSDEHCPAGGGDCRRPDLFAFQMASIVSMYTSGILGIHAWYITGRPHSQIPQTPEGRLFGYLPESERLSAYALAYQLFDFVASLGIPEHCTPIMMTHHLLAGGVAYCSIRYQFLHYYGFFFLGLSEVSTMFLAWIDLSTFFPPIPGSAFDLLIQAAGPCFVLSFILFRVILWWPTSLRLFRDAQTVWSTGKLEQLRPGQSWVLWVFLGSNFPLGILQLYWLGLILVEVQKTLLPGGEEA
jgi:hypothetical protein